MKISCCTPAFTVPGIPYQMLNDIIFDTILIRLPNNRTSTLFCFSHHNIIFFFIIFLDTALILCSCRGYRLVADWERWIALAFAFVCFFNIKLGEGTWSFASPWNADRPFSWPRTSEIFPFQSMAGSLVHR